MAPQLCQLEVGVHVSCLSKFLHPSDHIRHQYPNPVSGHCLQGCIIVWQVVKRVSKRDQLCIVVQHDDFKANEEFIKLHAVKRYFCVAEEGDPDQFFDNPGTGHAGEEAPAQVPLPVVVEDSINGQSKEANTIKALCGVIDIDDDNEPASENVPRTMDSSNQMLLTEWGHNGFCYRKNQNLGDSQARLNFPVNPTTNGYYVQLFEGLFPEQVLTVVFNKVNENMHCEDDLTYGEFPWWSGIWVLMSMVDGADHHSFWTLCRKRHWRCQCDKRHNGCHSILHSCHERIRLCDDVDVDIWYALEYGRNKEAVFHCGWSQESS